MSARNKNFLVAYVCLVGVPIAGLLAVLDVGRGIRAPRAIGGVWEIHADQQSVDPPCTSLPRLLKIIQSGEYLTISTAQGMPDAAPNTGGNHRSSRDPAAGTCACSLDDDLQGDGRMSNAALSARELQSASKTRSGYLYARLEGPALRDSLVGKFGVDGSACAAAPFSATRVSSPNSPKTDAE